MKMTEYDMNRAQLRLSLFLGDMPEVEKTPSEIKREIKAAKKAQKKAEALQKQKDLVWVCGIFSFCLYILVDV